MSTSYFLVYYYCFSFLCSLIRLSKSLPACSADLFLSLLSMSLIPATGAISISTGWLRSRVMIFLGIYYWVASCMAFYISCLPGWSPLRLETFLTSPVDSSNSLLFSKLNSSKMEVPPFYLNLGFNAVNIQSTNPATTSPYYEMKLYFEKDLTSVNISVKF